MSSCCIGLCVYNNEKGLPHVLNNIDILRESQIFDNIKVIVFYDISSDASLSILREYERLHSESITINENSHPLLISRVNTRVKRIANARNGILNIIRERFSHYEYFAMMDSNEIVV